MRCGMCGTQFVWDDNPPEAPEPEPEPLLSLADFAVLPAAPEPEPEPEPEPAPEPVPLEPEPEPELAEPPIRYDYDIFAGIERRKLTAASRDFEAFTLLSALGCYEGEELFLSVHPDPAVPPKATAVVFSPPKNFRVGIGEKPRLELPTVRDEQRSRFHPSLCSRVRLVECVAHVASQVWCACGCDMHTEEGNNRKKVVRWIDIRGSSRRGHAGGTASQRGTRGRSCIGSRRSRALDRG